MHWEEASWGARLTAHEAEILGALHHNHLVRLQTRPQSGTYYAGLAQTQVVLQTLLHHQIVVLSFEVSLIKLSLWPRPTSGPSCRRRRSAAGQALYTNYTLAPWDTL